MGGPKGLSETQRSEASSLRSEYPQLIRSHALSEVDQFGWRSQCFLVKLRRMHLDAILVGL